MPFGTHPLRIVILALAVGVLMPVSVQAQQPAPPDSATIDSSLVDSLQAALDRFKAASSPAAADSARLRRWADSLRANGKALQRQDPEQARMHLKQALQARRALSDSTGSADLIRDIGITHFYQSRYEEAIEKYRKSLARYRCLTDKSGIAANLTNMGLAYSQVGQYEKAYSRHQDALLILRDLGNRKRVAQSLNNLGVLLQQQGRYSEALTRYREALGISREIGSKKGVSFLLNNIGGVYRKQGKYDKALARYQKSLQIKREIGDRRGVASSLGNIGILRRKQAKYEDALSHFQEALRIYRDLEYQKGIAETFREIGSVYRDRNQYERAFAQYRNALQVNREIGNRLGVVRALGSLGAAHLEQGSYRTATDTLMASVHLAEKLRENATSPEARRSLLSTQIETYRALTHAHVRGGQPDLALRSAEQARARLLADRLFHAAGRGKTMAIPPAPEVRRTLDPEEVALLYANTGPEYPLTALVVTRDTTVARLLPDSTVRARIGEAHPVKLNRLREKDGPLTAALGDSRSGSDGGTPSLAEVIRLYRHQLAQADASVSVRRDLARRVHGLLIEPIAEHIPEGRDEWVVVPTGALGYLPFEPLRDSTGQYLVEKAHVRYGQSITVLRWLQKREHPERKTSLLAVGGATYMSEPSVDEEMVIAEARRGSTQVQTEAHAATLLRSAERRMEQGRSPRPTYAQLGYQTWMNLPGTKKEAEQIGAIAGPDAKILTSTSASEPTLRSLSKNGTLDDYRRVHFATHGIAVPEMPELSALVLSQAEASDSLAARDGYLTMEEIADLKMQADVAVLSACQTGLGKIVAGEGVVSLSHAFLRAGANATLVSQWKVLDKSTRQFMTAVYERAKKEDTSFAEAVTETKRAFIAGEHGTKSTDPLRWAPFVYYGRE